MTFYRALIQRACIPLCGLVIALASGCATATKPAPQPAATSTATPPPAVASIIAPTVINPSPAPVPPAVVVPAVVPPVVSAPKNPVKPIAAPAPPVVASHATIIGSEEASMLFDNFTAFVTGVDGTKNPTSRAGWDTALTIDAGHRMIEVEFNRGVFVASTNLEFDAKANANYAVRFITDAELFGHNTFCEFWIIDLATGNSVTKRIKATVKKITVPPNH